MYVCMYVCIYVHVMYKVYKIILFISLYLYTQREMRSSAVPLLSFLLLPLLFCVVVEVHSQTYPFVRFGSTGPALSNHSYVNLTAVGNSGEGSDSVQCVTDLTSCCHAIHGGDRGDWYFPNGTRLQFRGSDNNVYERREFMRVDLRRRNSGVANGIYQCTIETNAVNDEDSREIVYVGLYASGGEMYMYMCSVATCIL